MEKRTTVCFFCIASFCSVNCLSLSAETSKDRLVIVKVFQWNILIDRSSGFVPCTAYIKKPGFLKWRFRFSLDDNPGTYDDGQDKKNCCFLRNRMFYMTILLIIVHMMLVKIKDKNSFVDVICLILHNTIRYLTHLYYSSFQVPSTCPCAWNQLIHCRMCK